MNDLSLKIPAEKRTFMIWRKHGFKLLSIGLSLIALITAVIIHNNAEQSLLAAKGALQQQQATNIDADQSANLLNKYLVPYKALQERKVIAPPARLQWLETLQNSVNDHLIPSINFVLSPTAPASTSNTIYTNDIIGVKVTPMRVEFILLHEGDLLRLLNEMHTQAKGLFSVQNCDLARSEEHNSGSQNTYSSSLQVTFKGSCELLWYSLSDITSAWEAPSEPQ